MHVTVRYSYELRVEREPDVAVFFDIFRASTAIAALLAQRPAELLTSADAELALAKVAAGYRLISEVHAGGLDNSPTQIAATDLRGARVVHKSTNLTHAIFRNLGFRTGLIGSFANIAALIAHVRALQPKTVELIAAGHIGKAAPATEDMAAAKHAAASLRGDVLHEAMDLALIKEELARKVLPPDFGPHYWDDTKVALTLDAYPYVGEILPHGEGTLQIRRVTP